MVYIVALKPMYKIIGSDGKEYGPVSAQQIREWLAQGRVNANTRVLAEGSVEWKALSEFPEFGAAGNSSAPPPYSGAGSTQHSTAEKEVNGPAIGLMVTAGVGFVFQVLGFLGNVLGMSPAVDGANAEAMRFFSGTVGIFFNGVGIAIGIVILVGALKMKKLESRGWAMTASILALVPCVSPCCIVGLPMGIWSLVVLGKPHVKSAFPQ